MIALLGGSAAVLLLIGVPIAIAFGAAALLAIVVASDLPPVVLMQRMYASVDSTTLLAIPFFLLAGEFMARSGLSLRIARMISVFVGTIRGGLGIVTVGASMLFAGVSGSAVADTVAIGSVTVPSMKKSGYDSDVAGALVASAGTIGVIIPPSIPFIVYGVVGSLSISKLFLAGVVPGVLIGVMLMVTVYVLARRRGYVREERISIREAGKRVREGLAALITPVLILGGIFGGIVTPTESAVIAVLYSLFIGTAVYRTLSVRDIVLSLRSAVGGTAVVMLLLATSSAYTWMLTEQEVPHRIGHWLQGVTDNKYLFLLILNGVLLLAGVAIEVLPAITVLVPILQPIAAQMGIDPIQFAVIFVVNLMIGSIHPPAAPSLVASSRIAGVSITRLSIAVIPFILAEVVVLLMISYIPELSLWLPGLFD